MSEWEELMKDAERIEMTIIEDVELGESTTFYLKEHDGEWICWNQQTGTTAYEDVKEDAMRNVGQAMVYNYESLKYYTDKELGPRMQLQKRELVKLFGSQDE